MTGNKILIVEDNLVNLELAADLLEAKGFVVLQARTAEAGLRLARRDTPDLVLMDISLPGMDGLCATKALKTDPATRHLTVIALTAHAMKGDEETALNVGCDGYLTKPIDTKTFVPTVTGFLASAQSRRKHNEADPPTDMENKTSNISRAAAQASFPGCVLIVDDEEPNRTLLRDSLEALGYEVAEAENGAQTLQSVSERAPDVILLDVMMPEMDGFEVCRRLKKDPKTAPIPILMVTALSERKERLMGIAAGANDFLNKPIDLQDVTLRTRNAVSMKRLLDQLRAEQERSELLLLNILPKPIAERLKNGEVNIADRCPEVTVLFADLAGFTTLSGHIEPDQVVYLLNEIFSAFDLLADKHGLEKIKTIGDAYMVAGGIPLPRPDHAEAIAQLALDMRGEIERFNSQYNTAVRIRMGISTGPVIAGIIGRKKFAYDLWGDTVNVASRLESSGEAGCIQVDESTYERLQNRYRFERRHTIDIKGRGKLIAYWLCNRI